MHRPSLALLSVALWLGACSDQPLPPPADVAVAPLSPPAAPPDERVLSEAEYALLKDDLEDLRAGVRPFDASALGICVADGKGCGRFIGADAPDLPPGEYLLSAELRAPRLGPSDGWPVAVSTDCTFEGPSGARTTSDSKSYTVRYAGEERGYRLRLRPIRSPNPGGAASCTYTVSAQGGDAAWSGSWSVPAAD